MPSMNDVLASIPGYGAYIARRQMNEQAGMQDLQQAGALQGILASVQQQQAQLQDRGRQDSFRQEVAALGPNATQEQMAQIASRYAQPGEALRTHQASLDRQATIAAAKEQRASALEQAKATAENTHAVRMAQIQDQALRTAETARHNKESEALQKQIAELRGSAGEAKPPTGYRKTTDGNLEPIPGGPADKPEKDAGLTPENAGKVAMSKQALDGIGTTRGIIFDKEGNLNSGIVGAINLPWSAGLPGNSQARIARSAMRNAIEAKLRIETGAAATEPEVQRTLARFMPTISDTKESAKFKLDELEKFFNTSLSLTKGVGATKQRLKFDAQGNAVP